MPPPTTESTPGPWLRDVLVARRLVPETATVRARAERIGAEYGMTAHLARVRWSADDGRASGTLILKLPQHRSAFERNAREVHFYETWADRCAVRVPHLVAGWIDAGARRVALLLEDVTAGRDAIPGDVLVGCDVPTAERVVEALAGLHAAWWERPAIADDGRRPGWLPVWGRGEADAKHPHARRAARYRRRWPDFVARAGAPAAVRTYAAAIGDRLEATFAALSALPRTLVHADVHLDNMILAAEGDVVLLDWQSVSAGPGVYDVARFLSEALPDRAAHAAIPDLLDRYHAALLERGVPPFPAATVHGWFAAVLPAILAGFISGYAGRDDRDLLERERAIIRRSLSADGLAGVALRYGAP